MSRKEILIIFLIICCLFSLQAVAAASDGNSADNVVLTIDSNVSAYSLPNTDNQLRDGSDAGTFSDLQNELSPGGDIVLTKNYTYDSTKDSGLENGISVPNKVNSITGSGKIVIDASQQARIFNIHSSHSVTLTGITFINANADGNGGSINSDGTLIISNCNFTNNAASGHGGAVYLGSSDGDTIVNCDFEGNVAGGNGGAIDWYAGSSDGEIIGSTFTDNTAKRSGGAVHWSGHYGTIKDSKFTNNVATGDVINEIGGILGGGDGGAVLWVGSNGTIDNCIFIDNFAHYRGGAVFLHGNSTENCTNTTVSNSNFEDNIAGLNGGAIDWQKGAHDGKLLNSNFTRNTAWRSGGAVYWYGVNGTISYCNFDSNDAVGNVTQHDKGIIIYDNIGGHGGAVLWAGTLGDADNSNFTNNTACRYGGAVYLQSNSEGNCTNTTFIHCNFKDNEAGINGGAIDWYEGAHDGGVIYCDFTNNKAGSNGGAIFWSGHHGEIHYSNFTNNIAKGILTDERGNKGDGGAIIWSGINGTVTYCRFVNNTADQRGGGVYLQNCTHGNCDNTTFSHSIFINNTAGLNGGAIDWHAGASHGNVSYCNFENNIANRSAGAIYWSGHNGTVEYSNFTFNKALGIAIGPMPNGTLTYGGDGGAIMWTGAIGSVENSLFSDNTAVKRGGAIFLQEGTTENCYNTTFSNSKFINNFAGTNGGAIDWHRGAANGTIEYCLFENNIANRSAGAVFWNGRNGTIIHSNFTQNEAKGIAWAISVRGENNTGGDGGAIMWSGSVGLVDDCRFIDNTAAERGGGIFLQGTEIEDCYNTTFKNSYFEGNVAGDEGGAINWDVGSQNGYVYNVEFVNNTAYTNGGAIHWYGYNGTIRSSTFRNNRATGDVHLYNMSLTLDKIEVYDYELPDASLWTEGKLYVLVSYEGGKISKYGLYVSTNDGHHHHWALLKETPEVDASPVDWAVDEFFGGDGGSIIWHGDVAHIDNCTFIDSNSARRGGAVYMTGGDHVEFTNCSFENCTSGTNGGGLDWFAGANYGKVIDCNFTNTHAARSAGAIYYDGDNGEMRNIIIKNATAYGGARNESGDGKVKYACWDLSHWDTNTTGGDGGAMMFTGDHITVSNVNFTDCAAAGRGGAIFVQDNHNVTIDSCTFLNNHALGIANNTYNDPRDPSSGINHDLTGHGGAVAFDTGATESSIINSIFNNNTAKLYGGAVHYREGASEDKVINSTFNNNYADEDGGALFIDGDRCELHDSTFNHNYVGDDGGAIFWHGQGGIINNINCTNNSGISTHGNSKGGTICLTGNDISLSNSRFEDSYAKVTGGAMFVTGNNVNIAGTGFKNCNVSNSTGGALQLLGNNTQVRDCTFEDCHADAGSAIYTEGNYVKVINSEFTNNNVTGDGGAVYVFGDYSELHNSTFISNFAGDDGGAIYWEGSHGTIYNITCENNKGVSFNESNSKGGTICLTGEDISISSSSFKNSSAGDDGGAIFISGNNVDIIGSDFEACNSSREGGAIYVLGDDATISDCTFEDCTATQGGAIYVEGNGATISAEITDTHATGASSHAISIDYKLYKDNIKEIKYDIIDSIDLVATINGGNISNETIADLNTTLNDLYKAVNNILMDNGINTTNVTAALAIVSQLKANLTQLNATLPSGEDKNITLKLLSEIENIENELNQLVEISETLNVPGNILQDVNSMSGLVPVTPGPYITNQNITDLTSDLNNLSTAVENILNGTTFNSTNIERALKLINDLTNKLSQLNATVPNGNDKNNVIDLLNKVNEVKNDLNALSKLVVVPEVVSMGGAIYVSGDNAVIENSLINDTDAVYGGGIYIAGNDVKVDKTDFINLYSVEDGGAIYITGQRGRLYNSKFINNTAGDDGGAINWDGNYGIIENIVCENNKGISFNGSSSNGGTISLTGNDTSISKSSFSQSNALISGGAIFVTGNNVNITDSEFENCYVSMDIAKTNKTYANGGGAIYLFGDSSNVVNCNFDNSTGREGGAIYVQGNEVTIDNSGFTDSFALNGGAIYINGTHTVISNSNIDDSNATYSGGAVFISGIEADIINSSFENTNAFGSEGNGGGAIYIEGENADVIGSNFTNNHANSNSHAKGGAMYITGANAEIIGSKFTNADSNLQGGAIYVNGTDTIINGSEFYNCKVDSPGSEGGAIYIEGKNAIVEGSNFVDSSSLLNGGAIYINGFKATVKDSNFTDSYVTGEEGTPSGGAIYIYEANATIEGSIFKRSGVSNSKGQGGTIFIHGDNTTINGSEFESSSAKTGGTLYLEGDYTYVIASSVNGSYANDGGALYSIGSNSKVVNSNFTNNLVRLNGGALYWSGESSSRNNIVDGCMFTNNTAYGYTTSTDLTRGGGAIYWSQGGTLGVVRNSGFYYNSVQSINKKKVDGGAILWDKSTHALVENCIFVGNFVTTDGDTSGTTGGDVWAQGGAMYLRPNANYTVRNCKFENCSSSKEAGALYIQGLDNGALMITLENCEFINNVAQANGNYNINGGGAIQIKQIKNAVFNNLTFINNTANKGGALCVFDKVFDLVVDGANFTGNKADRGSAISASKGFTLKNAVLLENRATTTKFDLTFNRSNNGTIDILLEGKDNRLNAMYVSVKGITVTCTNVTYWTNNNISTGKKAVTSSSQTYVDIPVPEAGIAVLVEIFDGDNNKLHEGIYATDASGKIHLNIGEIPISPYSTDNIYVNARLLNEDYYTMVKKTSRIQNVYIDASALDTIFHGNTTVTANITAPGNGTGQAARGIVSVYIDDVFKGNMTIENSRGSLENILTNVTADKFFEVGNHTIFLKYWGDAYFGEANKTISFNITKAQSNITLDYYDIGYDFYVTVTIVDDFNDVNYRDANGTVIIDVYNVGSPTVVKSIPVDIINSTGFVKITELLPANYTLVSHYSGDKNYNASVNSTLAELHKKADAIVNITVNAYDIMVNETVYINVTFIVPPRYEATGNVTLYLDNEKYTLLLNNSKAYFNKTGLSEGVKIVTVCYDGSDLLIPTSSDTTFRVNKYNTTLSVNTTNITHIQHEVINITLLNDTVGVVSVFINDDEYFARINNGTASLELPLLPVGEYNVTVVFPGDNKYNNNTVKSKFKVGRVTPNINIEVENVTYGDSTKIIVSILDCVEGNVTIKIDGTQYGNPKPVENGRVEFAVEYLTAGNYTLEALYSGDVNHTASSAVKDFAVYKANRTIVIEVQNITYGEIEHIKVYVNATGNVTIFVDGRTATVELNESDVPAAILRAIINAISEYKGKAALDVYNLNVGKYPVDVVYNGNENYNKATARATFIVSQVNTNLVIDTHRVQVWNTEYINVTVKNSTGGIAVNATGKIKLYIDGVEQTADIVDGVARFNTTPSSVGQKVVWAFYDGDNNFIGNRAMKTFVVAQRIPYMYISAQNITVGQNGNITVQLPENATGYVEVEVIGDKYYYNKVIGGHAAVYPNNLKEGDYQVYVIYYGDQYDNYTAVIRETYFIVSKAKVNVTIDVNDTVYDNAVNIVVYVDDGVEGNISIKLDSIDLGTYGIFDGKVNITIDNPGVGSYTVYAEYNGNDKYKVNKTESKGFTVDKATPTIIIDKVTVDANTNATIVVRINQTATGKINITVNGTKYNATIENGVATFTVDKLLAGKYNITAEYSGDNNYTSVTGKTLVDGLIVTKVTCYQINVTANDTEVDFNSTIIVKVPIDATGNVSIYVDDIFVGNATISQGIAQLNVTKPYGYHAVNVTFTDGKYDLRYATTDFWVFKHESPLIIDVDSIFVGDVAYINVTASSDNVTIEINGKYYNSIKYENGIAQFVVSDLQFGNKTVVAIYGGSNKYLRNTTTANFTVDKRNSQVNVTAIGNGVGDNATISVKVQSNATGYVTVDVNGTNYTIKLNNVGEGSVEIAGLGNGTYYVHATYLGDDQYKPSENNTETFEIRKTHPTISIDVDNVVYGNHTIIEISIPDASGNLTIKINDTDKGEFTLVNGKVVFDAGILAVGNYTVHVLYKGDDKYATDTADKDFNVTKANPTVNITESVSDANTNATIEVRINDDASGTLNITVDGKNYTVDIIGGVAIFTVDKLPVNLYEIKANYAGDANYTSKHVTLVDGLNITKDDSYLMNVTAGDVGVGENTTIIVSVPADATGTVTVWVNGTKLTNATSGGKAIFYINQTKEGRYVVNATLTDDKYATQTVETSYYVSRVDIPIAITIVNENSIYAGDTVKVVVSVPEDVTENVTIEINGIELTNVTVDGNATFFVPAITYGNKTVVAAYAGDDKYVFNSTTKNFTVNKRNSQVNVTVQNITVGGVADIEVKVPANATGYVVVVVDGVNYTANLTDGIGHVYIRDLVNGTYNVNVTYIGDGQYLSSINSTKLGVTKSNTTLTIAVDGIDYGQTARITVTVGPGDATGFITLRFNNTQSITLPIVNSMVEWNVSGLAAGTYRVWANYSGDGKYNINNTDKVNRTFNVNTIAPGIKVVDVISEAGKNATVIVRIDSRTTENVTVTVNSKSYSIKPNVDGIAVVVTDVLENGTFTAVADYAGDTNFTSGHDSLQFTTNKTYDYEMNITAVDIKVGDPVNVTVNVPADAEGIVKLDINGHNYTATVSNGKAVFNNALNLAAGRYNITAYFGNDKYANKTAPGVFYVGKLETPITISVDGIKVGDKVKITVTVPAGVNENVTIEIDGVKYNKTATAGVAEFEVQMLTNGTRTVVAAYCGDGKYEFNSTTANFTVSKRQSYVNVEVSDIDVGDVEYLNVTIPDNATGFVVVNVGGTNYTVNMTNGFGTLPLAKLANGTYLVVATYLGDEQYFTSVNDTQTFTVSKVPSQINMTISHDGIIANGTDVNITIRAPADATGKVNITIHDDVKHVTYFIYVNDGVGVLHLESPEIGIYNVTAKYLGDGKYIGSENETLFEVYLTGRALHVETGDITVAQNENIRVWASGNHTGDEVKIIVTDSDGRIWADQNVTFDAYHNTNLNMSSADLHLGLLPAGGYTVDAFYLEVNGTKVVVHTGSSKFTVSKLNSTITIKDIVNITVGGTVTIELEVDPQAATGNISVFVNGVEHRINTSELTLTIPGLSADEYHVQAFYFGDHNYYESNATAAFRVSKNAAPIAINVTNSKVDGIEQINVTLPGDATGRVLIDIGDNHYYANVTGGVATFNITKLDAGNYNVTATYEGDDKYFTNKTNSSFIVSKYQPEFAVNGTNITVGAGEFITFETQYNITGIVKVEINGRNYTSFVNEGKGNLTVYGLDAGEYKVTVYFEGDYKYLSAASPKNNFTVSPTAAEIIIVPQNITYGETETVIIYINAEGKVNVTVDTFEAKDVPIVDGKVVIDVDGYLTAGNYTVHVDYSGNVNVTGSSAEENFTVAKADSIMNVIVQNITYGDVEHIRVTVNAEGNITVKVNGKETTIVLENGAEVTGVLRAIVNAIASFDGKARVDVPGLDVGEYPVEVTFNGNENYNKATVLTSFFVTMDNVTMSVEVADIRTDGKEVINVTFSNTNVTGEVIINVDGINYTRIISDGKANLTLDKLSNSTHSVVVIYEGDRNFNGTWASETFNVTKVEPAISVDVSDRTVGQTERIVVHLPDNATGYVVIDVDGTKYHVDIVLGQEITLEIDNLENKTYSVDAYYSGDGFWQSAAASDAFNVSKAKVDVAVIVENITLGEVAIINITVTPDATGNVTVTIGDEFNRTVGITDGVITVAVPGLTVGDKTVVVRYNGDGKYLPNSSSTTFSVAKLNSASNIQIVDNGNGTVTVIVPENATGNVTIYVDGKNFTANVTDGIGVVTLENVTPGKHDITVVYSGDENHTNATAYGTVVIPKLESPISVNVHDIYVGDVAYINITVPTGDVTIEINGKSYAPTIFENGVARFVVENLAYGNKTVAVVYAGNSNYTENFTTANFTVNKRDSFINVEVSDIIVRDVEIINVTVPNNATGLVVIDVNGTKYTVNVTGGVGSVSIAKLGNGTYNVIATYLGDDQYFPEVNGTQTFSVDKVPSQINITVSHDGIVANGTDVNITIKAPVDATGKVEITVSNSIENVTYTIYVHDGVGVLHLESPEIGIYNVTAKYLGDDKYVGSENKTEFDVYPTGWALHVETGDITVAQNENIRVWASGNHTGDEVKIIVTDSDGRIWADQNVTFDAYHNTNLNMSSADLHLGLLPAGGYTVDAFYLEVNGTKVVVHTGSSKFTVSKLNSTIKFKEIRNITVGENVTIELEFEPSEATGNISVFVNGVIYVLNTTTLTLTLSDLPAEEYIVHAVYYGDHNYEISNASSAFKVSKINLVIGVNATSVNVGEDVIIEITAPGDLQNPILVDVAGMGYYVNITGGKGQLYVPNLASGEYNVTVRYLGDDNYTPGRNATSFRVSKVPSTVNVTADDITVGEKAIINVETPKDLCGNVTVSVDGTDYTVFVSGGVGTLIVPDLGVGSHTVNVTFDGCKKYGPSNSSTTFNVNKINSTAAIKVVDQGNGTVVVVVPDNATGNVTIKVGNNTYNATVVNGTAVVTLDNVTPGDHTVEVIYSGDDTHTSSTVNATVVAPKYDTFMNVTVSEAKEGETTYITVTVPENATGNVTVTIDGQTHTVEVHDGVAVVPVDNLTSGSKSVIVEYSGDDNYASNYTVFSFDVEKAKVAPDIKVVDNGNGTVVVVVGDNATGNVTIKVGDKTYNATVVNGTAVVELGNVTPGEHSVEVIYSGDDTHSNSTVYATVVAPKYDTFMNVTVPEAKEGETTYITVKLPGDATGNVTVTIDGQTHTVAVEDGVAVVPVDNLTSGSKSVIVEYSGDDNYASNYTVVSFDVEKAKVTPDVKVVDNGNGTVVVVVGDNATGNVTIKVGDKTYNATVVNGTAVVTLDNVTPGEHSVEVIYSGDDTHSNSTVYTTVTAPKYDTFMNVTVPEAKEGETTYITVKLPGDATGNVTVTIDGQTHTVAVEDGVAVVPVDNLAPGSKSVIVEYSGDDNYDSNYTVFNFDVEKAKVTPDVKVVDNGNGTVVVVVGDNATGNVTIKVGDKTYNATVVNGTAVVELGNVTPGEHTVEVIYSGDGTHANATVNATVTAPKYDTFMNVTVPEAKEGETTYITVKLPGDATGNVTVTIDGQTHTVAVEDGVAVVPVDNLTSGSKSVIVEYSGDDNYDSNYTVFNFDVEKVKATTEVYVVDQGNGTVVVIVPDNATGNVTVKVGNDTVTVPVVNGTAVVTLDNLTPGKNTVEVIYSGDDTHSNATFTTTLTGPKHESPISVTAEATSVGDKAVITVNLPENAKGNVTIEVDGVKYTSEVKNGTAKFEIENLTDGTKTVAVEYSGDDSHVENHTTASITVSKRPSWVNATIDDISVGENVNITVYVPEDATGQVLIDIDGVGYYVNVTNGVGTTQIPRMPDGIYDVNLTYIGDGKYLPSSNTSMFDVSKVKSFVIPTAHDIYVGNLETITLTVPSDATGNVTVIIDGEEYNFNLDDGTLGASSGGAKYTVAISGGSGVLVISGLPKGEYTVSVRYNGDDKYLPAVNSTTFIVMKSDTEMEVIDQGNGTLIVRIGDNASGNVTIKLGNETYEAEVINGTAVVHLTDATPGTHEIEVTYSGDDSHSSKTVESTVVIPRYATPISVSTHDIYVGDNETVVVTLPEDATGTVTIEINGKVYSTDKIVNGKAEFNVPGLAVGNKTVAVKYSGDKNYEANFTTGQFEVKKIPSNVKATSKDIKVGKDGVITVTVPENATGKVYAKVNGVGYYADIINGKAKIVLPDLPAGKYMVHVTYDGDEIYLPDNTTTEFTVSKYNSPVKADSDEIHQGEDGSIVVNVPKDAKGTVTIKVDGRTYTAKVKNGEARFIVPGLTAGVHDVDVYYSGDGKYKPSHTKTHILVKGETPDPHGGGSKHASAEMGISLSSYETGNPIFILLVILLAIGTAQLRRFKK